MFRNWAESLGEGEPEGQVQKLSLEEVIKKRGVYPKAWSLVEEVIKKRGVYPEAWSLVGDTALCKYQKCYCEKGIDLLYGILEDRTNTSQNAGLGLVGQCREAISLEVSLPPGHGTNFVPHLAPNRRAVCQPWGLPAHLVLSQDSREPMRWKVRT